MSDSTMQRRERSGILIAVLLSAGLGLAVLALTVALSLSWYWGSDLDVTDFKRILQLTVAPLIGLVGCVTAFYFGYSSVDRGAIGEIAPQRSIPLESLEDNAILLLQARLRQLGLYGGQIDGIVGSETLSSFERFQQSHDLSKTGKLDIATAEAIGLRMEMLAPSSHQNDHLESREDNQARRASAWQRAAIFLSVAGSVVTLMELTMSFPNPTIYQYEVFRFLLALGVCSTAIFISGALGIIPRVVRVGGALGIAVFVYVLNPTELVVTPPPASLGPIVAPVPSLPTLQPLLKRVDVCHGEFEKICREHPYDISEDCSRGGANPAVSCQNVCGKPLGPKSCEVEQRFPPLGGNRCGYSWFRVSCY